MRKSVFFLGIFLVGAAVSASFAVAGIPRASAQESVWFDESKPIYGSSAPAGYVTCGMQSGGYDNKGTIMMNRLIFCPLTQTAVDAGVYLGGFQYEVDSSDSGGNVVCSVPGQAIGYVASAPADVLTGIAKYGSSGQADFGMCTPIHGVTVASLGDRHEAGNTFTDYWCPTNTVVYGAQNAPQKNDSWNAFYCVTFVPPPQALVAQKSSYLSVSPIVFQFTKGGVTSGDGIIVNNIKSGQGVPFDRVDCTSDQIWATPVCPSGQYDPGTSQTFQVSVDPSLAPASGGTATVTVFASNRSGGTIEDNPQYVTVTYTAPAATLGTQNTGGGPPINTVTGTIPATLGTGSTCPPEGCPPFTTLTGAIATCSLDASQSTIYVGDTVRWTANSNTPGRSAFWYGTKRVNGVTTQDANGIPAGTMNFSVGIPYTANEIGSYTRYIKVQVGSDPAAVCTSNTVDVTVSNRPTGTGPTGTTGTGPTGTTGTGPTGTGGTGPTGTGGGGGSCTFGAPRQSCDTNHDGCQGYQYCVGAAARQVSCTGMLGVDLICKEVAPAIPGSWGSCNDVVCSSPLSSFPPSPSPSCTFSASPDRIVIPPPGSANLSWSCQNAANCSISGVGTVSPTSGSRRVSLQSTTAYALSCSGPGGNTSNSATIRVFDFSGGTIHEIPPR